MGPLYNFGSLLAGVPDWSQRQATTAIGPAASVAPTAPAPATSTANPALADWQKRYDALLSVSQSPPMDPQDVFAFGNWGLSADPLSTAYTGPNAAAFQALQKERVGILAAQPQAQPQPVSAMSTPLVDMTQQKAMQDAYNAANGGTYLGGMINASYATPQTGLQPGSQIAGQVAAATGPSAVSGAYTPSTNYAAPAQQTQPSGWGGPFTNKNPWALS